MKLLVISHSCATSANRRLYREMQRAGGWDITLAIPANWRDEFGNVLDQDSAEDFPGTLLKVPVLLSGNIILHAYLRRWRAFIVREKFDAVYMHHEPYALATAQVGFACRDLPVSFGFYSCQNILKTYPIPFDGMEKFVYRRSDFSFPVTRAVTDVLRHKGYLNPCTVAPLPVDLEIYKPASEAEDHALIPRHDGETVLGYVGRVVPEKGLRTLALALGRIRDLDWKFSVVGSGDYLADFTALLREQGVADRVTFHGYISHDQTPRYLSAFDVLVLPSETQSNWKEQFGRVIPEAMACGTAVIGSDSGEIPTLIGSSRGGRVFPERNAEQLSEALRSFITDPTRRREHADVGRRWVHARLSLPAVASEMSDAIRQAVAHRKYHARPNS